jgi:hypothetical protein
MTALAEAQVGFVIVGSMAVTIHGSAYVTYDLDCCYARDAENLSRLVQALQPCNPGLRGAPVYLPFRLDQQTPRSDWINLFHNQRFDLAFASLSEICLTP